MTGITILIVDDDQLTRETLRRGFEAEGWAVLEATDEASMLATMQAQVVDLVTLGRDDGLELAPGLRATWNVPILILTTRHDPLDRARGLESGADDYILKPFHIREVVLRVRRVLEIYGREISHLSKVMFDHTTFELRRGLVKRKGGGAIDLTGLERRLLELFVRHPGRILSRDEITQALYGRDWTPEERSIDGHVARLRRKLGPDFDEGGLIQSVRGVGYVFAGEVKVQAAIADGARGRDDGDQ